MAVKTEYTEAELAAYADKRLGPLAATLGIVLADGDYDPIVEDAILEYGNDAESAADISGLKPVRLLLACVRWKLWQHVTQLTNGKFALSDSGTSLSLNQINQQARETADEARDDVKRCREDLEIELAANGGSAIAFYGVTRSNDPYQGLEEAIADGDEFSQ